MDLTEYVPALPKFSCTLLLAACRNLAKLGAGPVPDAVPCGASELAACIESSSIFSHCIPKAVCLHATP